MIRSRAVLVAIGIDWEDRRWAMMAYPTSAFLNWRRRFIRIAGPPTLSGGCLRWSASRVFLATVQFRFPASDELFVRSGAEPTEADVRAALEAATFYARRMFDEILRVGATPAPIFAAGGWARSQAFIELRASIFGQPVTVVDEPELTAIGAALIAAQGAGVALPFAEGLNLQEIQPVTAWVEPYARLYQDYQARLDYSNADSEPS